MKDNIIDKNIDGIRKIHPSELKKSRELVLSSIGEDFDKLAQKSQVSENDASVNIEKRMDGLSATPRPEINPPAVIPTKIKKIKAEQIKELKTLVEDAPVEEKKIIPMDSILASPKERQTDRPLKEEIVEKKVVEPKRKQKKIKKPKAEKKKLKAKKAKAIAKKKIKKKIDIAKKYRLAKEKFKISFNLFKLALLKAIKKGVELSIFALLTFFFLYLLLASVVLNFTKDSSAFTAISTKISIPAIISSEGIIYFDKYKNIYNTTKTNVNDRDSFNEELASIFILDRLFEKHQVDNIKELEALLVFDEEVNIAPINRIKKIKDTIQAENSFVKIAKKFGDVYQANINDDNVSDFSFSDSIRSIQVGETSGIVVTHDGYYIVHCFERVDNDLTLSYVYIPAVSLDAYLAESAKDYKFWNLTNF